MQKPITALAIVRVACGFTQTLIGGTTILLGLFIAVFGMAMVGRLTSSTQELGAGILIVGLSAALLLVAGVVTLLQGLFGIANRHHTFAIGAALVAVTVQGLLHGIFHFKITPGMIGLFVFECATIPVAWLSGLPRPAR